MNAPTILISLVILFVFAAIVARSVYNKRHHKSSCGCGCEGCAGKDFCHPNGD